MSTVTVVNTGSQVNAMIATNNASYVPVTTSINGHALSADVTVSKSDVSLGNVANLDTSTTANIVDSTNKRFVTDAQQTVIGNTSNTNSGDETTATIKSKLSITTLSGSNTGDQDLSGKANLASPTFTGTVTLPSGQALIAPALGTPASGTLTNCTFPTLNQNTSGSAGSVTGFSPTSGKTLSVVKTMTLTAADDTGSYTLPTGTKTLLATDGSAANLTSFPTLNQNTSGTASNLSGTPTLPSGTTLVAPVLGTPASGTMTNVSGTAASLTAGNVSTVPVTNSKTLRLDGNTGFAYAKYSFGTDGGAVSTITPGATVNTTIPANAILVGGVINVTTACTSGGSATVAIGCAGTGGGTATLMAATAVASLTTNLVKAVVPTMAVPKKLTGAGSITFTIATATLTAGVIEVWMQYFLAAA